MVFIAALKVVGVDFNSPLSHGIKQVVLLGVDAEGKS